MRNMLAILSILLLAPAAYSAPKTSPKLRANRSVMRQSIAPADVDATAGNKDEKECLQRDLPEGGVKWTYEKGRNPDCRVECGTGYSLSGSAGCKKDEAPQQAARIAATLGSDTVALIEVLRLDLKNRQDANRGIEKLNQLKEEKLSEGGHYDTLIQDQTDKYNTLIGYRRGLKDACSGIKMSDIDNAKTAFEVSFWSSIGATAGGITSIVGNFGQKDDVAFSKKKPNATNDEVNKQVKMNKGFYVTALVGSIVQTVGAGVATGFAGAGAVALGNLHKEVSACQGAINDFFDTHSEY